MKYFLDTAFLIDYMADEPAAVARFERLFEDGDVLYVNEIAVCELATGVRPERHAEMQALLEPLEFIQPGPDTALRAGQWRRDARSHGSTLSLPDALIAAAAYDSDAAVVTRNTRDFLLTPVRIEAY